MALVVGNATVATGMSPIVEAGLYADPVFIDGVSFSSRYNIGSAGQIQVEKYAGGRGVAPSTPGANFTDRDYENTVVDINVNNSFKDSAKVPNYYEATMPTDIKMNKTLDVYCHKLTVTSIVWLVVSNVRTMLNLSPSNMSSVGLSIVTVLSLFVVRINADSYSLMSNSNI